MRISGHPGRGALGVQGDIIHEGLKVEPLPIYIQRSQLRWFSPLMRMPPGHFHIWSVERIPINPQLCFFFAFSYMYRFRRIGTGV